MGGVAGIRMEWVAPGGGIRMAGVGGGRGNLRVAKTPPLQSALRGISPTIICAHMDINGNGERRITTRHWFGRALALLGTSPTKLLIDNRPLSPPCAYRAPGKGSPLGLCSDAARRCESRGVPMGVRREGG